MDSSTPHQTPNRCSTPSLRLDSTPRSHATVSHHSSICSQASSHRSEASYLSLIAGPGGLPGSYGILGGEPWPYNLEERLWVFLAALIYLQATAFNSWIYSRIEFCDDPWDFGSGWRAGCSFESRKVLYYQPGKWRANALCRCLRDNAGRGEWRKRRELFLKGTYEVIVSHCLTVLNALCCTLACNKNNRINEKSAALLEGFDDVGWSSL